MKYLIMFLLLIGIVAAQNELDISLIEYNADTNYARIQLKNNFGTDLHNLKVQIDNFPAEDFTPLLKYDVTVVYITSIGSGIHKIKVITDETIFEKELSFQASIQEKRELYEKEQREKRLEVREQRLVEERSNIDSDGAFSYVKYLIALIGVAAGAAVVYYIISRKK